MNRIKKIALYCGISVIVISSSVYAFGNKGLISNTEKKAVASNTVQSPISDTEKKKLIEEKDAKINRMFDDVEADIVKSFNINGDSYTKVMLEDFPKFTKGEINNFSDVLFCKQIAITAQKEAHRIPIGSLEPFILINNNKQEFLFLYKDKDGNNICKKYSTSNINKSLTAESEQSQSKWSKSDEKKIKGKQISIKQY